MTFAPPPPSAAWQHRDARIGVEVATFGRADGGWLVRGATTAVEQSHAWAVRYAITLAADWTTRDVEVVAMTERGERTTRLRHDGTGGWTVDAQPRPDLAGCLDVDLEASVLTNAFPVHRVNARIGATFDAPAAYVRAVDLQVSRLEQRYRRLDARRFHYTAPAFDFAAELRYDEAGFVLDYPGLAARIR